MTVNQIRQKRTNNPNSIEIAALEAVIEWWDSCIEPHSEKVKIIANCVEKIGKTNLVSSITQTLGLEPPNEQHANSAYANDNDNNSLNGEQCSAQQCGTDEQTDDLDLQNGHHANSTQANGINDLNGCNGREIFAVQRNGADEQTVIKQVELGFQNGHNLNGLSPAPATFVPSVKRKFDEENACKTKPKYGRLSVCSGE